MFARSLNSVLALAAVITLLTSTGCLTDVLAPEPADKYESAAIAPEQVASTKIGPGYPEILPCTPSPDLVPNDRIDTSDLARFASFEKMQDLSADFTENGVVNGYDRRVLEFFLGRDYTHDCLGKYTLRAGGANPDINGSGWIDASDLAAFFAAGGDVALADFNADGAVDALDQIILEEHLGQHYPAVPCREGSTPSPPSIPTRI